MQNRKRILVWYAGLAVVVAVGVLFSWPLTEVFAQGAAGGAGGSPELEGLNFFSLLIKGSYFMLPILVMSVSAANTDSGVVAIVLETWTSGVMSATY